MSRSSCFGAYLVVSRMPNPLLACNPWMTNQTNTKGSSILVPQAESSTRRKPIIHITEEKQIGSDPLRTFVCLRTWKSFLFIFGLFDVIELYEKFYYAAFPFLQKYHLLRLINRGSIPQGMLHNNHHLGDVNRRKVFLLLVSCSLLVLDKSAQMCCANIWGEAISNYESK